MPGTQIMSERSAVLTLRLRLTRVQVGSDDLFDNRSLENTPAPLHLSIEREPLDGHDELAIDRGRTNGFSEHCASRHLCVGGRKKSAESLLYHLGLAPVRRTAPKKRLIQRDIDSTRWRTRPIT